MDQLRQIVSPYTKLTLEALSILAATALFFGFLIVNLYLGLYGFWDFSFLKVEYVSAGALFIIFIGFAVFTVIVREKLIQSLEVHIQVTKPWRVWIAKNTLKGFTYLLLFPTNSLLYFTPIKPAGIEEFIIELPRMILWVVIAHLLVITTKKSYEKIKSFGSNSTDFDSVYAEWGGLLRTALVPLLALMTITQFAAFIYPSIPKSWGGGKSVSVTLYLNENTPLTSPLPAKLIHQSSDFVFIDAQDSVYSLKQSEVVSIQYMESDPAFKKWFR